MYMFYLIMYKEKNHVRTQVHLHLSPGTKDSSYKHSYYPHDSWPESDLDCLIRSEKAALFQMETIITSSH